MATLPDRPTFMFPDPFLNDVGVAIDAQGRNPVDVRARRFDAMGNPVGNDFVVNTTTAAAQGQPAAAFGPGGESGDRLGRRLRGLGRRA